MSISGRDVRKAFFGGGRGRPTLGLRESETRGVALRSHPEDVGQIRVKRESHWSEEWLSVSRSQLPAPMYSRRSPRQPL